MDLDDRLRWMLCGLAHPATAGGMAYLPERALPDTFGAFVALRQGLGLVPNIFRAQTLLPSAIEAEAGHPAISWNL